MELSVNGDNAFFRRDATPLNDEQPGRETATGAPSFSFPILGPRAQPYLLLYTQSTDLSLPHQTSVFFQDRKRTPSPPQRGEKGDLPSAFFALLRLPSCAISLPYSVPPSRDC
jgi:hypothetical protein